jgi:hypothetical protein
MKHKGRQTVYGHYYLLDGNIYTCLISIYFSIITSGLNDNKGEIECMTEHGVVETHLAQLLLEFHGGAGAGLTGDRITWAWDEACCSSRG